jgi:hypothetical protein
MHTSEVCGAPIFHIGKTYQIVVDLAEDIYNLIESMVFDAHKALF